MPDRAAITVCICTMDRPEALQVCLQSIQDGTTMPAHVIVSDDSRHPELTRLLCADFPFVQYIEGPRRGLSANRNWVIARADTSHVALIDDDGAFGGDFMQRALAHANRNDDRTVVSGNVLDQGQLFKPGAPDFWGRFTQEPKSGRFETIQLNCNLFPRIAFDVTHFDELIHYGFEDMDLCSALLAAGYKIFWDPELVNQHFPPAQNTKTAIARFRSWEQARYYTSLKRYFVWERASGKGILYLLSAAFYTAGFSARWRKWRRIPQAPIDLLVALRLFLRFRAAKGKRTGVKGAQGPQRA